MPKVPASAVMPTGSVRPTRTAIPDPLWTQTTATESTQVFATVPTEVPPTRMMPIAAPLAYVTPVRHAPQQVVVAAGPAYFEEVVFPAEQDGPRAWVVLTVAASVILAGIIGVLIGRASKQGAAAASSVVHTAQVPATSIFEESPLTTAAVVATPPAPATALPTANNDLQSQVAALTAARNHTAQQLQQSQLTVSSLQAALRQAQAASSAPPTTNPEDASQLAALQRQLADATQHAATLQDQLNQSTQAVAEAQAQLATATQSLTQLGVTTLSNFVNGSLNDAQQQADANGWTIVQQQVSNGSASPGTIIKQTPAAGSTMVKGSALFLQVAAPAPTTTTTTAPTTAPPKSSPPTTTPAPTSTGA